MIRNTRTLVLAAAVALAMPPMAAMADGGMGGGMGYGGHSMGGMHHHDMHGCSDRHGRMDRHDRMERMAKKLGLTDAQKKQMQALHEETRKTMRPLFRQKRENMRQMWKLDPDSRDYMAQVKKLAEKQGDLTEQMVIAGARARAKFRAILTSEQKQKLKQMREQRRKAYEEHHRDGGGRMRDM